MRIVRGIAVLAAVSLLSGSVNAQTNFYVNTPNGQMYCYTTASPQLGTPGLTFCNETSSGRGRSGILGIIQTLGEAAANGKRQ